MSKSKSGERTLITSVVFSSPGPLVVGVALFFGRSSTQIADFIRRSSELVAIIISLIVYRIIHKDSEPDPAYKAKLERNANICVGAAMCLSGIALVVIAIFSSKSAKGNVIPGLVIAILGVIANSLFCLRYSKLNRQNPDAILAVQSKLYFAKFIVDACITFSLLFILIDPNGPITPYVDLGVSVIVAVYLIINGISTIKPNLN